MNDRREIFGWTMYDWANSAFSTTVVSVFFGPYLSSIAKASADASGMIYVLGIPIKYDSLFPYCVSLSLLLQVFILPILGAIADYLQKPVMMYCGDDAASKQTIGELIAQLGWEPLDVGGLNQALHLEHMTLLWVRMVRVNDASPYLVWTKLGR